jgi:glycosyltransferase involved in cell wall biosynthesis
LPANSVYLVENGVDVARFTMAGDGAASKMGPLRILYVGILTARKGVLDLLIASDRLDARGLVHEVVLVGGSPDEGAASAEEVVVAAGAREERVRMSGPKSLAEMPVVYRDADVFCLPSWWEAMPLSLLEAMAAGLPVVVTDVGDVNRIVDHGVNGLVVPPRDPDALVTALADLLGDAGRRRRLGREGRNAVAARWNAERTIDRIAEMYRGANPPVR